MKKFFFEKIFLDYHFSSPKEQFCKKIHFLQTTFLMSRGGGKYPLLGIFQKTYTVHTVVCSILLPSKTAEKLILEQENSSKKKVSTVHSVVCSELLPSKVSTQVSSTFLKHRVALHTLIERHSDRRSRLFEQVEIILIDIICTIFYMILLFDCWCKSCNRNRLSKI